MTLRTVKPVRPPVSRDHLSIKTTWCVPIVLDSDLCKETTSLLRPLFGGPEVVAIVNVPL